MKKFFLCMILAAGLIVGLSPATATGGTKEPVYEWCWGATSSGSPYFLMSCIPWGNQVCTPEICYGPIR